MTQPQYLARHECDPSQKVCAKFSSGVRFGVGFSLERSCGTECHECSGTSFHRRCRLFDFRNHYEIMSEMKHKQPVVKVSVIPRLSVMLKRFLLESGRLLQRFPVRFHSFVDIFIVFSTQYKAWSSDSKPQ